MGAGLPIVATIKHLRETGDRLISIEGIFSGSVSFIFNMMAASPPSTFSEAVAAAAAKGFTEPDPRADLSGLDVARKVRLPPTAAVTEGHVCECMCCECDRARLPRAFSSKKSVASATGR